jgi:1-acyl-sn-glycerol-3-phosphate acyltransferase
MAVGLSDCVRWAHGVTYMLPATVAAWFMMVYVAGPLALLLLPWKATRRAFRPLFHLLLALWMSVACASLEWLANVRVRITTDEGTVLRPERSLMISNHPTHLDWHPIFCLGQRCGQAASTRVLLKEQLRKVPIYSWAWQAAQYVFLKRHDKEKDVAWIHTVLECWKKSGVPASWLLFPEGTDMSESNVERSQAFARERGLQVYHHIIHPRTAGFVSLVQQARSHLDAVYDITIAFQFFAKVRPSWEARAATGPALPLPL